MAPPKVPDGCPLKPHHFRTLQLLCRGHTIRQIAMDRGVVARTVRNNIHEACRLLGVQTVEHAIALMGRRGWWDWTPPASPDFLQGRPFLQAHRAAFDAWLHTRFSDQDARDRMDRAVEGALVGLKTPPRRNTPPPDPLRELLQHLAADTLNPTPPRGGRHG